MVIEAFFKRLADIRCELLQILEEEINRSISVMRFFNFGKNARGERERERSVCLRFALFCLSINRGLLIDLNRYLVMRISVNVLSRLEKKTKSIENEQIQ